MAEFSANHAAYTCAFLESLVFGSGEWEGKPFRLQPWQREPLEAFYGTLEENDHGQLVRQYQYLYLEIPKKNGKTGIAAGLGLYHTFADGERSGEVYAVAADKDNAGIVFRAALAMLEAYPALKKRARVVES